MNLDDVLMECQQCSIKLSVGSLGDLHVNDPEGKVTSNLLESLKINKSDILDLINSQNVKPISRDSDERLPASIYATLDFSRRTNFKKEIPPKLNQWLDSEWMQINTYENSLIKNT